MRDQDIFLCLLIPLWVEIVIEIHLLVEIVIEIHPLKAAHGREFASQGQWKALSDRKGKRERTK